MSNKVYSVRQKLPRLNVLVIGYDEYYNSYTCAYNGEVWYFGGIICDQPKFWRYKKIKEDKLW